jgi:hypothetical protein
MKPLVKPNFAISVEQVCKQNGSKDYFLTKFVCESAEKFQALKRVRSSALVIVPISDS